MSALQKISKTIDEQIVGFGNEEKANQKKIEVAEDCYRMAQQARRGYKSGIRPARQWRLFQKAESQSRRYLLKISWLQVIADLFYAILQFRLTIMPALCYI